mgnify:CR=1 FL=1
MLHRGFKVVDRCCKVNLIPVDIGGKTRILLRFELTFSLVVREREPASSGNISRFVKCIHFVFISQALCNNLKLQLTDRTKKNVSEFARKPELHLLRLVLGVPSAIAWP